MKKILILLLLAAAAVSVSCAREGSSDSTELQAEALAAYMQKYHPDAEKTALGVYIYPVDEKAGTGDLIDKQNYIRINYTATDRDGSFKLSTFEEVNRANKNYNARNYYGPEVRYRAQDNLTAGVEQLLSGEGTTLGPMRIGGTRKALIPGWLSTSNRHDTEEEYIKNEKGTTVVYSITLLDAFDDEEAWEKDSLARFIKTNYPKAVEDTSITSGGWYYLVTKPSKDTTTLVSLGTFYCNYTLTDLSGRVIDTSVEKVARANDLYSSSVSYEPKMINGSKDVTKITMGNSSTDVVDGFANAFLHMHPGEAGKMFFWSGLGYASRGSGNTIPAYCPLCFEIEIVDKP